MGKWQKRQCPLVILHFFLASHCKQNLKTFTMQAKVYHVCFGWCASQFHKSPCEGANVCEERRNKTLWQVKNKSWWTIRSSGIIMYFYCGQPATPRCNDVPCVAGLCTPSSEWWTPGGHKDLPSHSALCQRSARTRLWACQSWRQFCRPSSSGYRRQGNGNYDYGSRKKIIFFSLLSTGRLSYLSTPQPSTPPPSPRPSPSQPKACDSLLISSDLSIPLCRFVLLLLKRWHADPSLQIRRKCFYRCFPRIGSFVRSHAPMALIHSRVP